MNNRIQSYQTHPLSLVNIQKKNDTSSGSTESFQDILKNTSNSSLKISKHARQRINERNISLDSSEWVRIGELIRDAKEKGINDSLVLTSEAALIINAKNNTVITAMDRQEAKSQIFTNINGTIILD